MRSANYHCQRTENADRFRSMSNQWHSSTPSWHFTSPRRFVNQGTPVSLHNDPSFKGLHFPSRPIRRNLFPPSYNRCMQNTEHQSPTASFQDFNWGPDSRDSSFYNHQDATTDGGNFLGFPEKNKSAQIGRQHYSAPFWSTGEFGDSYSDVFHNIPRTTNQHSNGSEFDNFYPSRPTFLNSFDDRGYSQICPKFDANYSLDYDALDDHRSYSPVESTPVQCSKIRKNNFRKNSKTASLNAGHKDLQFFKEDALGAIMWDTIWTSVTGEIEPSAGENQSFHLKRISSNGVTELISNDKTDNTEFNTEAYSSEALDSSIEHQIQHDQGTETDAVFDNNLDLSAVISDDLESNIKTNGHQSGELFPSITNIIFSPECDKPVNYKSSDENIADDNKQTVAEDPVTYKININLDTHQYEIISELISQNSGNLDLENFVRDHLMSEKETISESFSTELTPVSTIKEKTTYATRDITISGNKEQETVKVVETLDTVDEHVREANKIEEIEIDHSLDMLGYDVLKNNDLYSTIEPFGFDCVSDQIEELLSSITNYCLEEPAECQLLSILESKDIADLLCVSPNSVLEQNDHVEKIITKPAKVKAKRKQRKRPISSFRGKQRKSQTVESEQVGFKVYCDVETQVLEEENIKAIKPVQQRDVACQWEEKNLVHEQGNLLTIEDNRENRDELLSFTCRMNEEKYEDKTLNEELDSGNLSLTIDKYPLKRKKSNEEESSPISTTIPLTCIHDLPPVAPGNKEIEKKDIPQDTYLTESDYVKMAISVKSNHPSDSQDLESSVDENNDVINVQADTIPSNDNIKSSQHDTCVCVNMLSNLESSSSNSNNLFSVRSDDGQNVVDMSMLKYSPHISCETRQTKLQTRKAIPNSRTGSNFNCQDSYTYQCTNSKPDDFLLAASVPKTNLGKIKNNKTKKKRFNPLSTISRFIGLGPKSVINLTKKMGKSEEVSLIENRILRRHAVKRSEDCHILPKSQFVQNHNSKIDSKRITKVVSVPTKRVLRKRKN